MPSPYRSENYREASRPVTSPGFREFCLRNPPLHPPPCFAASPEQREKEHAGRNPLGESIARVEASPWRYSQHRSEKACFDVSDLGRSKIPMYFSEGSAGDRSDFETESSPVPPPTGLGKDLRFETRRSPRRNRHGLPAVHAASVRALASRLAPPSDAVLAQGSPGKSASVRQSNPS